MALEPFGAMACAACCARFDCAACEGAEEMTMLQSVAAAKIQTRMARRNAEFLSGEREIPVIIWTPEGNFDPEDKFNPEDKFSPDSM